MIVEKPMFIEKGYAVYTDEGIKIKEDAPQWAKDEYKEYIKCLNGEFMEEEE